MTSVDTKGLSAPTIGNDSAVDTKSDASFPFGNDGGVDTKVSVDAHIGNDGIGFIRVRKRKLKGGHRDWRDYRAKNGELVSMSASYDLVRAVRVNGKPRHQFVIGLGSLKDYERDSALGWFWARAIWRMTKHGLAEDQRQRLSAEMVRKGARLPTIAQCEEHARNWPNNQGAIDEIVRWLQT
jgi:hypothetical protein